MKTTVHVGLCVAFIVGAVVSGPDAGAEPRQPDADEQGEDVQPETDNDARPSPQLQRPVYDSGRFSVGLDALFSRTTARTELVEDDRIAEDTTRFARVNGWLTIGVADGVHIGPLVGFVTRRVARRNGDPSSDDALALQPMVQYFLAMTRRLGLYGQLAPGLYVGQSERLVPVDDAPDRAERTRTRGFVLTLGAGVNYRVTNGFQFRLGVDFNGLWGREAADELGESLSSTTRNIATSIGVRYTF